MSSSSPEGNLSKRKHSRLNLKSAVALATLSLAGVAPADAQTSEQMPSISKSISNERSETEGEKVLLEARRVLSIEKEEAKKWRSRYVTSVADELERNIRNTEDALSDPNYLRGLQKIQQYGGKIEDVLTAVPQNIIKDTEKVDIFLSRIPKDLIPNIQLQAEDFKENPEYSYDRPRLKEIARQLNEGNIRLSVSEILPVVDLEEGTPDFVSTLLRFIESVNGEVHPRNILADVKRGKIAVEDFVNPDFTAGLTKLMNSGLKMHEILNDSVPISREDLFGKLADPAFVESYLNLKLLGYLPNAESFAALSPDVVKHPNFRKNLGLLKKIGIHSYSPHDLGPALHVDGLETVLENVPQNRLYGSEGVIDFVKAVGADTESWRVVQEQYALHRGDEVALRTIRILTPVFLKNSSYMHILNDVLNNKQSKNPEDPWTNRYEAINQFLTKETGKNKLDIAESLEDYIAIVRNPNTNPLVLEIIKNDEDLAYRTPVLKMNKLHDGPVNSRLEAIRPFDARVLFDVMHRSGADAYLSTFRLLYNGNGFTGPEANHSFLARAKSEYGSLPSFFRAARPDHKTFGTFLELLSQNDILDTFLTDIGPLQDQQAVLREFLFDASSGISDAQALTLSDLLRTTKGEPIREFVFGQLRSVQERGSDRKDKSPRTAGLLIADYFQGKADVPEWARASVQEYGKYFPEIKGLSEDQMFRKEGGLERNVQVHFFYNDSAPGKPQAAWDGHHSFKNFITSLGGAVEWNKDGAVQRVTLNRGYEVKDESDYIVIRQADNRTKREVVMYAIKPDRTDETVAKVGGDLVKNQKPQIATLRGHSYHAYKMIKVLTPDVVMVNLGSCGGAKNISDVLAKAPSAQVMATRGVGTMLVNDVVIPELNRTLLRDGGIQWAQFGTQMTAEFKKRGGLAHERWGSYQMPDKNRIAHLIAALKALEK